MWVLLAERPFLVAVSKDLEEYCMLLGENKVSVSDRDHRTLDDTSFAS